MKNFTLCEHIYASRLLLSLSSEVQIVLFSDYVIINTQTNTVLEVIWHFLAIIKIMTNIYKVLTMYEILFQLLYMFEFMYPSLLSYEVVPLYRWGNRRAKNFQNHTASNGQSQIVNPGSLFQNQALKHYALQPLISKYHPEYTCINFSWNKTQH